MANIKTTSKRPLKRTLLASAIALYGTASSHAQTALETDDLKVIEPATTKSQSAKTTTDQSQPVKAVEVTTVTGLKIKQQPFNHTPSNSAHSELSKTTLETVKFQEPVQLLERVSGMSQVRNLRYPISSKSYTLVLVDGLAMTSPYSSSMDSLRELNNRDIERIEITKGLGSARNPASAFGGTIDVKSLNPSRENTVHTHLEAGSYNHLRGGVQAQGSVGRHGYITDINLERKEGYRDEYRNDRNQLSGKGLFELSQSNQLVVRGEYLERDQRFLSPLTEAEYREDSTQAGSGVGSDEQIETWTLSASDTQQLDDASQLRLASIYRQEDATGVNLYTEATDSIRTDVDTRLEYQRNLGTFGSLNLGANYIYGRSDFTRFAMFENGQANRKIISTDAISHTNISAAYADYRVSPIESLEINAGLRYENVALDSFNKRRNTSVNASFDSTDPRLGFTYQYADQHSLWGNYSEGFYAPNTRELFTDRYNANPDLNSEQLSSTEFGLRGQILVSQLSYSANLYVSDIKDFIVIDTSYQQGRRISQYSNAGLVKAQGFELDLDYQIIRSLNAGLSYTYADNHYGHYINPYSGKDLSGNTLARSPDHHWNLRLNYQAIEGLSIELEWDGISSYYTNDDHSLDPSGKFKRDDKWHLRASYQRNELELWLHGLNLTSTLEEDVTYSRNSRYYDVGSDATVAVGIGYQFN